MMESSLYNATYQQPPAYPGNNRVVVGLGHRRRPDSLTGMLFAAAGFLISSLLSAGVLL